MRRKSAYLLSGSLASATLVTAVAGITTPMPEARPAPSPVSEEEHARTIAAMRPPKREAPVIAVLGQNDGAETTDYVIPYSVLVEAEVGEVLAVATEDRPLQLTPALKIAPQSTTAAFDARYPEGADYVIVPRIDRRDDPTLLAWIRAQAAKGSVIVGICSGAKTLSSAGLLAGRRATGHWYDRELLLAENPTMTFVRDRRYVVDRGVVTTTGVSASLPASLALVEAIAGRERAARVARSLGVSTWDERHDSDAFSLALGTRVRALFNRYAAWRHESFAVPVAPGVDELALAFSADAWSRSFRSQAFSVAATGAPVQTRRGLSLLPDRSAAAAEGMHALPAPSSVAPAAALPEALDAIAARYGERTAAFVALQLEYLWASKDAS